MAREQDKYFGAGVSLGDPANESVPIVPGTPLDDVSRGLFIGTGGNVNMKLGDDDDFRLFKNLAGGTDYGYRVKEVDDGPLTTAQDMLALY